MVEVLVIGNLTRQIQRTAKSAAADLQRSRIFALRYGKGGVERFALNYKGKEMKSNLIVSCNWPKGWNPKMSGDTIMQTYGSILSELVRIHPGCISDDRDPCYNVDVSMNMAIIDFLMLSRDTDHANEIADCLELLLIKNGLRYTEDWTKGIESRTFL